MIRLYRMIFMHENFLIIVLYFLEFYREIRIPGNIRIHEVCIAAYKREGLLISDHNIPPMSPGMTKNAIPFP